MARCRAAEIEEAAEANLISAHPAPGKGRPENSRQETGPQRRLGLGASTQLQTAALKSYLRQNIVTCL
jgi:hypothetical protein